MYPAAGRASMSAVRTLPHLNIPTPGKSAPTALGESVGLAARQETGTGASARARPLATASGARPPMAPACAEPDCFFNKHVPEPIIDERRFSR